eukprot:9590061-Ditylum_brightwellii.AAC.1
MADEAKDKEKHNSNIKLNHKCLLSSIHDAVSKVDKLLSSIKVKDERQGDNGSNTLTTIMMMTQA